MRTDFFRHLMFCVMSVVAYGCGATGQDRTHQVEPERSRQARAASHDSDPDSNTPASGSRDKLKKRGYEHIFRSVSPTVNSYFILFDDGTYVCLDRHHFGLTTTDRGSWSSDQSGDSMILRSGHVSHLHVLEYESFVAAYSPDHEMMKIWTATAHDVKNEIDAQKNSEHEIYHVYIKTDAGKLEEELSTDQGFRFFSIHDPDRGGR